MQNDFVFHQSNNHHPVKLESRFHKNRRASEKLVPCGLPQQYFCSDFHIKQQQSPVSASFHRQQASYQNFDFVPEQYEQPPNTHNHQRLQTKYQEAAKLPIKSQGQSFTKANKPPQDVKKSRKKSEEKRDSTNVSQNTLEAKVEKYRNKCLILEKTILRLEAQNYDISSGYGKTLELYESLLKRMQYELEQKHNEIQQIAKKNHMLDQELHLKTAMLSIKEKEIQQLKIQMEDLPTSKIEIMLQHEKKELKRAHNQIYSLKKEVQKMDESLHEANQSITMHVSHLSQKQSTIKQLSKLNLQISQELSKSNHKGKHAFDEEGNCGDQSVIQILERQNFSHSCNQMAQKSTGEEGLKPLHQFHPLTQFKRLPESPLKPFILQKIE